MSDLLRDLSRPSHKFLVEHMRSVAVLGMMSTTLASLLSATYNAPVLLNLSFNCLEEP